MDLDVLSNVEYIYQACICTQRRIKLPREVKAKRVCGIPENLRFIPEGNSGDVTVLTIEEIESIRLCDLESMDQDRAAYLMNISRGTLQRILYSAHKKVAEALCRGREIQIKGGHFELSEECCRGEKCCSYCCFQQKKINSIQGDAEDE